MYSTFIKYKFRFLGLLFLLILFCLTIKLLPYFNKFCYSINTNYTPNNDKNIVRIYYDIATTPTLYQVEDMLNHLDDDIVFLRWDRIPNLEEKFKNRKNVHVLKQKNNDGWKPADGSPILDYYKKHPNTEFEIHTNAIWLKNLMPTLMRLPIYSIKEIHVYEDGAFFNFIESQESTRMLIAKDILYNYYSNVPKIHHMEGTKDINSIKCLFNQKCKQLRLILKEDTIVEASIPLLKKQLDMNSEKKEAYFDIMGFNYNKYKKEMTHPFGVFTFTVFSSPPFASLQIAYLNEVIKGKLNYLINDKDVTWYYKPHPEKHQWNGINALVGHYFPNVKPIDSYIPMELFILADIVPDYIAGFSSGMYLNMPKESIALYVARPSVDPYLEILKKHHKIRPGRVLSVMDFDNSERSAKARKVSKFWVSLDAFFHRNKKS